MMASANTRGPDYFNALYAANSDPWRFATSDYEREKYALTLDVLPETHYFAAFEVGCSIGVLTQSLASRCGSLLAVDASKAPLVEAGKRCADQPNVTFRQMFVPDQWPGQNFDLVVLSEVLYFLGKDDVCRLATRVKRSLLALGDIVLVNWTGPTDYPLSGDEAVEFFTVQMGSGVKIVRRDRYERFRLDVLTGE
jgi:predicted TPR repeat methyltransferase